VEAHIWSLSSGAELVLFITVLFSRLFLVTLGGIPMEIPDEDVDSTYIPACVRAEALDSFLVALEIQRF